MTKYKKNAPVMKWEGDSLCMYPSVSTLESCLGTILYELEEAYRLKTFTDVESASFIVHVVKLVWDLIPEHPQELLANCLAFNTVSGKLELANLPEDDHTGKKDDTPLHNPTRGWE